MKEEFNQLQQLHQLDSSKPNNYELNFHQNKTKINLLEDIKLHRLPKIELKKKKEKHINTKLRLKEGEITISGKVTMIIPKIFELGRRFDNSIFEKDNKNKSKNKNQILNNKGIPLTHDMEFKIYKEDGKRMKNKTNHMKRRVNTCSQRLSSHSVKLNENFSIVQKSMFNNLMYYMTSEEKLSNHDNFIMDEEVVLVKFSPIVNLKQSHYKERKLINERIKTAKMYSIDNIDFKHCLNFALISNTQFISMASFKTLDQTNCIDSQCFVEVWKIFDSESILLSKKLFSQIVYFYRIILSFFIEAPRDWNNISISRLLNKDDFLRCAKDINFKANSVYENYPNERKYFLTPIFFNEYNNRFEIDVKVIDEILKIHENAEFNFNVKKKDITCLTGLKYEEAKLNKNELSLKSKIIRIYKDRDDFFQNIEKSEFNQDNGNDINSCIENNDLQLNEEKTFYLMNKSYLNVSRRDMSNISENRIKNFIEKTNFEKEYKKQNKPVSYHFLYKKVKDLRKKAQEKMIKQMNKLGDNFCKLIDSDEDIETEFDEITLSSEDLKEFEYKFLYYSELMKLFKSTLVLNMEKLTVFNVEDILFPDDNSVDFLYKSKFIYYKWLKFYKTKYYR